MRALQFNTLLLGPNLDPSYAVTVADETRRAKETIRSDRRDRFWSNAIGYRMLDTDASDTMLSSLPSADLLAIFTCLFPGAEVSVERHPLWRVNVATLPANKGDTAAARKGFQSCLGKWRSPCGHQGAMV